MISKFDLAKALRDQAKIVTDANSYTLVTNGEDFEPDVNDMHIEEATLFGDDTTKLGNGSSDSQVGIYQLAVHTPKSQNKWVGLNIIDILSAHFSRGLQATFNSQTAVIQSASLSSMQENQTHYIHNLSLKFTVIN